MRAYQALNRPKRRFPARAVRKEVAEAAGVADTTTELDLARLDEGTVPSFPFTPSRLYGESL